MNSVHEIIQALKPVLELSDDSVLKLEKAINESQGKIEGDAGKGILDQIKNLTTKESAQKEVFANILGEKYERETLAPIASHFTGRTVAGIDKKTQNAFLSNFADYLDSDQVTAIIKDTEVRTSDKIDKIASLLKGKVDERFAKVATSDKEEWEKRWKAANDQSLDWEKKYNESLEIKEKAVADANQAWHDRLKNIQLAAEVAKHTEKLIVKPEVAANVLKSNIGSNFKFEYNAESGGFNAFDKEGKALTIGEAVTQSLEGLELFRANPAGKNGSPQPPNQQSSASRENGTPKTYEDLAREYGKKREAQVLAGQEIQTPN